MAVDVVTFGCRLNASESEIIRRNASGAGLNDVVIVNSCAVTNEAVAQARQSIRRLRRERPSARIVVTGCAAQIQPAMFAEMAEVDRVIGNDDKMRGEAWREARTAFAAAAGFGIANTEKIAVADIMAVRAFKAGCRAPSCRCRTAAIIAAPSASFLSGAAIRVRFRWARWSIRCARSLRRAMWKSC